MLDLPRAIRMGLAKDGKKQSEVCRLIGTSTSNLSSITSGKSNPSIAMIQRIAVAIDMKLSDLIKLGED